MKIVLASGNAGKLKEFGNMLAPANITIIAQSELGIEGADETGLTFIENAILKARHASKESGLPALADDSGLAVDALNGAPGLYSARYSADENPDGATDQSNIDKLLRELSQVPTEKRDAQFHCVLVFVRHPDDPTPIVCHGTWHGRIATEQSGNEGFGYDPVFIVPELECSAAQLSAEQKASMSHRGAALRLLEQSLPELRTTA
ncbi:MAG: RdgB/HAM1 family non-canonical purine NTP pyrophosphatase [Oleiphilaceae bacterium]|nr:RdgB/HAM1 family non-canonical purine NTP pyrophosphatase [Oleiphilaceae bacterium]